MHIDYLWLTDFRSYLEAEFSPASEGITVVAGGNGEGKTNLIEAISYLTTTRSFRGSPPEALVRAGEHRAVVRADGERGSRRILIEAEIHAAGRDRLQVNGQPLRRSSDLLGYLQATVFSPDDLVLVKGGPQSRREYLDELLVSLHPRHAETIAEVARVLKQRNALLKSAGSYGSARMESLPADVGTTLDVWDTKLGAAGEKLVAARVGLTAALEPLVEEAYARLAAGLAHRRCQSVGLAYQRSWSGPLHEALQTARKDDLRRGITTVGPHRDEMDLSIGDLPARSHASQGEQRSLTLALRLGGHRLVTERIGSSPVLLLDDVFSELDSRRSEALLRCLPPGQAIVTTAADVPPGAEVNVRFRVEEGKLLR